MSMRGLTTFKKTCSFGDWLKLVDSLQPHMDKHGLKLIFAMESSDGQSIYDVGEAKTMEGVEAFVSDPEVIKMRVDAGVDVASQEVVSLAQVSARLNVPLWNTQNHLSIPHSAQPGRRNAFGCLGRRQ